MEKIISIPVLIYGLYLLSAVPIKNIRPNWSMTQIKTGAVSNLGAGLFFTHGACLTIFANLPFQSFVAALFLSVVPLGFFFYLAYKGYQIDRRNHEIKTN